MSSLGGSSLCHGIIPLPTDFPAEAAAWERSGHQVSAQILDLGLRRGKEVSPTQWPGAGNVTPHPRQIYQPSMGPVVAGDLISLGLRGGQEKKAARGQPVP